jgi:uncharacterized protein (DUF1330 family)
MQRRVPESEGPRDRVQVIAFVTVNEAEPQALAAYLEATGPLLARAGAEIVQRFALSEMLVGRGPAQSVIIVDYPSRAAVDQVFQSPEYAAIVPIRERAFLHYHIAVVSG